MPNAQEAALLARAGPPLSCRGSSLLTPFFSTTDSSNLHLLFLTTTRHPRNPQPRPNLLPLGRPSNLPAQSSPPQPLPRRQTQSIHLCSNVSSFGFQEGLHVLRDGQDVCRREFSSRRRFSSSASRRSRTATHPVSSLSLILLQFYSEDRSPWGPVTFLSSMWSSSSDLAGYAQQDAHEWVSLLPLSSSSDLGSHLVDSRTIPSSPGSSYRHSTKCTPTPTEASSSTVLVQFVSVTRLSSLFPFLLRRFSEVLLTISLFRSLTSPKLLPQTPPSLANFNRTSAVDHAGKSRRRSIPSSTFRSISSPRLELSLMARTLLRSR